MFSSTRGRKISINAGDYVPAVRTEYAPVDCSDFL